MKRTENRLRVKLQVGKIVTGSALFSWSPHMIEIAGYAGLDFIRIDTEHAWRRDVEIEHLVRAAWLADVVPIIRVDGNDEHLPRKAFEIGAGAIIATEIETVEAARALVARAKFPPRGIRGYSGLCWSGGWGAHEGPEWVEWCNREQLVGIMVENPKVIDRVPEIMAVEGLDFALFGPADYSMALGLGRTDKKEPRVLDALRKTIAAARASGKHVMYNPGTEESELREAADIGVTMLEVGNDLGIAYAAWNKLSHTFT